MENIDKKYFWLIFTFIIVFCLVWPNLFESEFYFTDDFQTQYMPAFYKMGFMLRQGIWPYYIPDLWHGGNFLVEYQYAVLNPVSLLTYIAVSFFEKAANAALFLVTFYYFLIAVGVYKLGKLYNSPNSSILVAIFLIISGNYLQYWYAYSWFPGLVSFAWLMFCIYGITHAIETNQTNFWRISIPVFLLATSGWPHALIFFTIFSGIFLLYIFFEEKKKSIAILIAIYIVSGILLSMPQLLSLVFGLEYGARSSGTHNMALDTSSLQDILNFSFPFSGNTTLAYIKFIEQPVHFVCWFAPLLLVNIRNGTNLKKIIPFFIVIIISLFLLMGPQQIGPVKTPIRFIPYFHLLIILTLLIVLRYKIEFKKEEFRLIAIFYFFSLIVSFQSTPNKLFLVFPGFILWLYLSFLFYRMIKNKTNYIGIYLLFSSMFIYSLTHIYFPGNLNLPRFIINDSPNYQNIDNKKDKIIFIGRFERITEDNYFDEFGFGLSYLYGNFTAVNGYSPISHKGLKEWCFTKPHGNICNDVFKYLFAKDELTGKKNIDLLGVNVIVISLQGNTINNLKKFIDIDEWYVVAEGQHTQTWKKRTNQKNFTSLHASNQIHLEKILYMKHGGIKADVKNLNNNTLEIVISRLFWPGYRAFLEDGTEIKVKVHKDIFPLMQIPAGYEGEIFVKYIPKGFILGLILGFFAILIILFSKSISNRIENIEFIEYLLLQYDKIMKKI